MMISRFRFRLALSVILLASIVGANTALTQSTYWMGDLEVESAGLGKWLVGSSIDCTGGCGGNTGIKCC
jgi:hypothetical protein